MRVEALRLVRAPGFVDPVVLEGLGEHALVLVYGPNGSGKSTLVRVALASLGVRLPVGLPIYAEVDWREGQQTHRTVLSQAPPFPPPPHTPLAHAALYRLQLSELLQAGGLPHDRDFARQLSRELSGGFDVQRALASFDPGPFPQKMYADTRAAERRQREVGRKHGEFLALEAELPALETERTRVADGQTWLLWADQLEAWLGAKHAIAGLLAQLERFPSEMDRLWPEALAEHDAHWRDLQQAQARVVDARNSLAEALAAHRALAFAGPTPSLVVCDALTQRAAEIARLEELVADDEAGLVALQGKRDALAARLWFRPQPGVSWTREVALQIRDRLQERERAQQAQTALSSELAALEAMRVDVPEPTPLREVADAWRVLSFTPQAADPGIHPWIGWFVGGAGLLLILLELWVAWLGQAVLALSALFVVGVSFGVVWRSVFSKRAAYASDLEGAKAVLAREGVSMQGLDPAHGHAAWLVAEQAYREARIQWTEAQRLEAKIAACIERERGGAERTRVAQQALASVLCAVGIHEALAKDDLYTIDQFVSYSEACVACEAAAASLAERRAQRSRAWAPVQEAFDEADLPLPAHSAELKSVLSKLKADLRALDQAERLVARHTDVLAQAEREVQRVQKQREAFWQRLGGERDPSWLSLRMDRFEAWKACADVWTQRQAQMQALGAVLDQAQVWQHLELDPAGLDASQIERVRVRGHERQSRYATLTERIGAITAQREILRQGRDFETARAESGRLEASLRQSARQTRDTLMAASWVEAAFQAQRRTHQAASFLHVQQRLALFTHGRYQFELSEDDGGFCARDKLDGQLRGLDALSDATRVQLVLAARLAAIAQVEGEAGPRWPLWIDEALTTSDLERSRVIMRSLARLAFTERQVFYFTADLAEIDLWRQVMREHGEPEPFCVSLSSSPTPLAAIPTFHPVPDPSIPENASMAELAVLWRVHKADGYRPLPAWSLWWLLHDDRALWVRLARQHIVHVLALQTVLAHGAAPDWLDTVQQTRLSRRIEGLGVALAEWRVGRGRPVVWEDVEASGVASTPAFVKALRSCVAQWGHDPEVCLAHVAQIPRFQRHKVAALRTRFEDEGILDAREPLALDVVVSLALAGHPELQSDPGWPSLLTWCLSQLGDQAPT